MGGLVGRVGEPGAQAACQLRGGRSARNRTRREGKVDESGEWERVDRDMHSHGLATRLARRYRRRRRLTGRRHRASQRFDVLPLSILRVLGTSGLRADVLRAREGRDLRAGASRSPRCRGAGETGVKAKVSSWMTTAM